MIKKDKSIKNIVVIGGGTGTFTVLSGLKKYPHNLTAIVSMSDDGGSTGRLRDELGVLPPGDVRRCLIALSRSDQGMRDLFSYRFEDGNLKGHNAGNIVIAALEKVYGSFSRAVIRAGEILAIRGRVIPVTTQSTKLYAYLEDGRVICGETNIDIPKHDGNLRIEKIFLKPKAKATAEALAAIKKTDLIVIGPGDLYTSLIPNLLVNGIPQAIKKSRARKVYVCNLMTKHGETNHFRVEDFIETVEKYLGKGVLNYVIYNLERPSSRRLAGYREEKAEFVELLNSSRIEPKLIGEKLITRRTLIRHDPDKLAKTIISLLNK